MSNKKTIEKIKNKFIYEFEVTNKLTKTQKIEYSLKLFNIFLHFYLKMNKKKIQKQNYYI